MIRRLRESTLCKPRSRVASLRYLFGGVSLCVLRTTKGTRRLLATFVGCLFLGLVYYLHHLGRFSFPLSDSLCERHNILDIAEYEEEFAQAINMYHILFVSLPRCRQYFISRVEIHPAIAAHTTSIVLLQTRRDI